MGKKSRRLLENLALYSTTSSNRNMKKGMDKCFLDYGIRKEDMGIIEEACRGAEIDADWLKMHILKPYNEKRSNDNTVDEKALRSIVNKALKKL